MDTRTAVMIWGVIMAAAILIYLGAISFTWVTFFSKTRRAYEGSVRLPLPPEQASKEVAREIARGSSGITGTVTEADGERLEATITLAAADKGQSLKQGLELRCWFMDTGDGCEMGFAAEPRTKGPLMLLSLFTVMESALAILAAAYIVPHYIISSDDPETRGQVYQTLQLIHFLWPGYLFPALYRIHRKKLLSQLQVFLENLPHLLAR